MVGDKCNIHGCCEDETVTDMCVDSMQLIKTKLLVKCNCNKISGGTVKLCLPARWWSMSIGT